MINDLLQALLYSALINNLVLCWFLGLTPLMATSKTVGSAARMGGAMVFTVTLASALCAAIYKFILLPFEAVYLQTFVYVMAIAAVVGLIAALLKRCLPGWYEAFGTYLPLLAVNSGVLGAVLLNGQYMERLMTAPVYDSTPIGNLVYGQAGRYILTSTVNGFGAGLGFALVLVIIAGIREKTAGGDVPEAFRGVPITLVTAGLVALAFYAFAY
ncbi:MAG: electron transport complex subunit RsxA [Lachnospiraceae bacterium]|jgi:electron transport complex protein RnfA|nr:electron transport complex subunit RsxA [Lachnospiraceae bacterium]